MNKYLIPFLLGVGVGVAVHKNWPKIQLLAGPIAHKALLAGTEMVEKGRESFWTQSEKFADLIAEIREEDATVAENDSAEPTPEAAAS